MQDSDRQTFERPVDFVPPIGELWHSSNSIAWDEALARYWGRVKPCNVGLERALDAPNLVERVRSFNAKEWYQFLRDEYFRWKYTDPRWYARTTGYLKRYVDEHELDVLDAIRQRLLKIDRTDVEGALKVACGRTDGIHGLGPPGASGLLALLYPDTFATVDKFVVEALQKVNGLPEAAAIAQMKPDALSISNGVSLIAIMQRKADENNRAFATRTWTPRKVDKVLWTYR